MNDLPPDSLDIGIPAQVSTPPSSDPFAGIDAPTTDISPLDAEYIHARAGRPYYNPRAANDVWAVLQHWDKNGRKEMIWDTRKVNMSPTSLKQKLTNGLLYLRDKGNEEQVYLALRARIHARRHLMVLNEITVDGDDLLATAQFAGGVDGEFLFGLFETWVKDPLREHEDIFKYPNEEHVEVHIDDRWQAEFRRRFNELRENIYGAVKESSVKAVYVKRTEETEV
jgi:hypothetical protein